MSFDIEYDAVFGAFHPIKGMAGMLEQFELQKHVHLIESMLTTIKGIEVVPRPYIAFFLRACDATTWSLNG